MGLFNDDFKEGRCHTWLWWRGIPSQCPNKPIHGDKCGRHGVPPGTPFKAWRVGYYNDPSEHEFVAETPHWLIDANGNRTKKVSRSCKFYATKIEALNHLLVNAEKEYEYARRSVQDAKNGLLKIQMQVDAERKRITNDGNS